MFKNRFTNSGKNIISPRYQEFSLASIYSNQKGPALQIFHSQILQKQKERVQFEKKQQTNKQQYEAMNSLKQQVEFLQRQLFQLKQQRKEKEPLRKSQKHIKIQGQEKIQRIIPKQNHSKINISLNNLSKLPFTDKKISKIKTQQAVPIPEEQIYQQSLLASRIRSIIPQKRKIRMRSAGLCIWFTRLILTLIKKIIKSKRSQLANFPQRFSKAKQSIVQIFTKTQNSVDFQNRCIQRQNQIISKAFFSYAKQFLQYFASIQTFSKESLTIFQQFSRQAVFIPDKFFQQYQLQYLNFKQMEGIAIATPQTSLYLLGNIILQKAILINILKFIETKKQNLGKSYLSHVKTLFSLISSVFQSLAQRKFKPAKSNWKNVYSKYRVIPKIKKGVIQKLFEKTQTNFRAKDDFTNLKEAERQQWQEMQGYIEKRVSNWFLFIRAKKTQKNYLLSQL